MKQLSKDELGALAGSYFAPEGLYQYIKELPFLGSLECNTTSLVAGQWTEVVITYTVGGSGLADGAWIKGTFKFYSVCFLSFRLGSQSTIAETLRRTGLSYRLQTKGPITMYLQNTNQASCCRRRRLLRSRGYQSASIKRGTRDLSRRPSSLTSSMVI